MENVSLESIDQTLGPAKSDAAYQKVWNGLVSYAKTDHPQEKHKGSTHIGIHLICIYP